MLKKTRRKQLVELHHPLSDQRQIIRNFIQMLCQLFLQIISQLAICTEYSGKLLAFNVEHPIRSILWQQAVLVEWEFLFK